MSEHGIRGSGYTTAMFKMHAYVLYINISMKNCPISPVSCCLQKILARLGCMPPGPLSCRMPVCICSREH